MAHQRCESRHPFEDDIDCDRPTGHTRWHKNRITGAMWISTQHVEITPGRYRARLHRSVSYSANTYQWRRRFDEGIWDKPRPGAGWSDPLRTR